MDIYKIYTQKFIHTVDTQWKITAIFIPLSLGGIVAWGKSTIATILVGIFSILLIWIWYFLERRNGRDLRENYAVVKTVESLFAKQRFNNIAAGFSILMPKHVSSLRFTRLFDAIVYTISFAWIVVMLYTLFLAKNS